MVGAGTAMLCLAALATWLILRDSAGRYPRFLALLPPAIALPYVANSTGWIFTEIGRQPWIVYGLQKTADAVSPTVSAGEVLTSLVGFTVLYGALMVADVYLLAKYARAGTAGAESHGEEPTVAPVEA
jgi:cytochrome d ubiquinol oxidase subunit I